MARRVGVELLLFPNSRHDDQVDVFAYAAIEWLSDDVGSTAIKVKRSRISLRRGLESVVEMEFFEDA